MAWVTGPTERTKDKSLSAILYEIAGHCGKLAHLFNRLAEMSDDDAKGAIDDQATKAGDRA